MVSIGRSLREKRKDFRKNLRVKMANHFPSLSGPRHEDSFAHMFKEDMHLGVMPYVSLSPKEGRKIKCAFNGEKSQVEKAIYLVSDFAQYDKTDPTELVCDVINHIAFNLSWEGKVYYELLKAETESGTQYFARYFTCQRVLKIPGLFYIQFVPKRDQEHLKAKYLRCDINDVFEVSIPKLLGGTKTYKNILLGLNRYSHLGPRFFQDNLSEELRNADYDFSDYRRQHFIYTLSITRTWGWTVRQLANEYSNEFFQVYRFITRKWATAILREHILKSMNSLLKRLNLDVTISIEGLKTAEEILVLRQSVCAGKLDFPEVFDQLSNL